MIISHELPRKKERSDLPLYKRALKEGCKILEHRRNRLTNTKRQDNCKLEFVPFTGRPFCLDSNSIESINPAVQVNHESSICLIGLVPEYFPLFNELLTRDGDSSLNESIFRWQCGSRAASNPIYCGVDAETCFGSCNWRRDAFARLVFFGMRSGRI